MAPRTFVGGELREAHLGRPGDDGCERADDRHEARQEDGDRAVLLEELVRLVEVALLEEPGVGLEHLDADEPADPVADLAAKDGGDRDRDDEQPDVEVRVGDLLGVLGGGAARGDQAGDEEQRVTRQHGEQHTRLDEDDQQQSDERPRAEPTDQVERVQDARQCHGIGGGLHQRQVVHGPQGYRRGAERG